MDLIAIPSAGRAQRQVTLRALHDTKMLDVYAVCVCVPEREAKAYARLRHSGKTLDAPVVLVPDTYSGIARTREWILLNLAKEVDARYVLMLDDDMDFCYRPDVSKPKLEMVNSPMHMRRMIRTMSGWLQNDGFVHVGLSARQGNNNEFYGANGAYGLHPYRDVTRQINVHAYDTKVIQTLVKRKKLVFGRVPVMEDFDITLQLLRMGYPNRVLFEYCWNQRDSAAKGGCSTYRTAEVQAASARKLAELHPGYVKVTEKKSKATSSAWKQMKVRVDVNVQWRKAYGRKVAGARVGVAA